MKNQSLLLTVALLALGGAPVWAAATETAPMPQPGATMQHVVTETPCECSDCCDCTICDECKHHRIAGCCECLHHFLDWLCYKPHTCHSPCCCCKGCSCGSPPVYTYFYCTCIPHAHVPFPPYIGQCQPPRERCCGAFYKPHGDHADCAACESCAGH